MYSKRRTFLSGYRFQAGDFSARDRSSFRAHLFSWALQVQLMALTFNRRSLDLDTSAPSRSPPKGLDPQYGSVCFPMSPNSVFGLSKFYTVLMVARAGTVLLCCK